MTVAGRETVSFELERFEMAPDERLEVTGRWFGVRGRRFVRPTLLVLADGRERRSLAVLEHKPWAARDGEPWVAVFPWERDAAELVDAELAVAPDIAVVLPAPTSGRPGTRRQGAGAARRRANRSPARLQARRERDGRAGTRESRESAAGGPLDGLPSAERDALERALEQERARTLRLRGELERADAARLEAASALARRDAALARLDEVTTEREAALLARDDAIAERDALVRDRDRLRSERDRALSACEAALEQRRDAIETSVEARLAELRTELERERAGANRMARALRQRDAAGTATESAAQERDAARDERDAARRERNDLLAQRDAARADSAASTRQWEFAAARGTRRTEERDAAVAERDRLAQERDRLAQELASAPAGHDPAGAQRDRTRAAPTRRVHQTVPVPQLPARQTRANPRPAPNWPARALAALVLLVFVVVFLLLWFSA